MSDESKVGIPVLLSEYGLTDKEIYAVVRVLSSMAELNSVMDNTVLRAQGKGYLIQDPDKVTGSIKPERYRNKGGKDLIDQWAEVKTVSEFRTIIISNIEKYSRRYGKKDDPIKEAKKIQDYANRLVQYEERLLRNE